MGNVLQPVSRSSTRKRGNLQFTRTHALVVSFLLSRNDFYIKRIIFFRQYLYKFKVSITVGPSIFFFSCSQTAEKSKSIVIFNRLRKSLAQEGPGYRQ